jgi:hypothetical protein
MTFDMIREAAQQPHTHPLVTVAIRSDGSVESVTFVQSSGVAAIDDAIRRIVQSQTPYQAFPPALAREWDVIEIRRTWYFGRGDSAVLTGRRLAVVLVERQPRGQKCVWSPR